MQHSSEFTPPPWPDDLRDLEARRRAEKADARATARPAGSGVAGAVSDGRGRAWAMAALDGESAAVASAENGRRNQTLYVAALKLGGIVAGGYSGADEVRDRLYQAAEACGLDRDDGGPSGVLATIESGMSAGAREPRHPPEREYDAAQARGEVVVPHGGGDSTVPVRNAATAADLGITRKQVHESPDPLAFTTADNLHGRPVPPRLWHVPDLIPAGTVTMFSGDGGTGKSLLALQLSVATAAERKWIGRPVDRPGKVLFLSAEDDADELHRRLADIADAEGIALASLDKLAIRSLAGEDALMALLDRKSNALLQTPLYDALDAALAAERPSLLVLDTLADLHSGEENSRAHARQFIGMLRGLAIRYGCAVLLLAHPSLTGMSSGSGLSGSTAWNASVRSRLYLDRIKEGDFEPDPDARRLTTKKANYGRTGSEIGLRWKAGVFVADQTETGLDKLATGAKAQRVFLKLLRQFASEGRDVGHSTGHSYAPSKFAAHPDNEGVTKRAFASAMDVLMRDGKLRVKEIGPPSRRTRKLVEVVPDA